MRSGIQYTKLEGKMKFPRVGRFADIGPWCWQCWAVHSKPLYGRLRGLAGHGFAQQRHCHSVRNVRLFYVLVQAFWLQRLKA